MNKKSKENDDIILTGQYLGVVEEYLPDKQSTYIKDGQIYASKSGLYTLDDQKKQIEIKTHQEKDRKVVKIGDTVIGTVLFLRQYSIGINFYTINRKIHFNSYYFGNIHVSQIAERYVEKISEAFQITDILRARVIKQKYNEFELTTAGKNLGVIYADCVICGTPLDKIGYNKLRCERCGHQETRKLSSDYRDFSEVLRF
ncbi:MAG: exosome complex RNA-binding protein Csl4 [Promethearchaeota archaeon]